MAPKRSKPAPDDFVVSDDHDDSPAPSKKKAKTTHRAGPSGKGQTDDEGGLFWEISNTRRVTVSDFKGKTMVSVREYYEKDGKTLPGRKGITLTMDQYSSLITLLPNIERALVERKEKVPRPEYGSVKRSEPSDEEEEEEEEEAGLTEESDEVLGRREKKKQQKSAETGRRNFEATDDEDE